MPEKMLAAVYHGPHDICLEEREIPQITSDEILVRVISTGICGTDIRIFHGSHRKYPPGTIRIPGHEVVGEIVEKGKRVSGLEVGQRVFIAPNMGCGHCPQCVSGKNNLCANYDAIGITIDGSFAEFMRVPAAAVLQGNIVPISTDLDPAAAALIEPFACVLRGQDALNIRPGESVLVVGAGPIGAMHVLLANLRGASKVLVSEINPERLVKIKELGAYRTINPLEVDLKTVIKQETADLGIDIVITAAPVHSAQESALEVTAIGGRINFFGGLPKDRSTIDFDSNIVHYKELIITGTTACSTDDCRRAALIADSGRVDLSQLIGSRYPLSEIKTAMQAAEEGKALKVVMEP